MVKKGKKIDDYTSKEFFDWFAVLYQAKFGRAYTSTTFFGLELKALKSLTAKYDTHEILCAIKTCIANNDRTVHIKYFVAGFDYYKPNTDRPDIYWYVSIRGDEKTKTLWSKYLMYEAKWFPNPESEKKRKNLLKELEKFRNAQTKKGEPSTSEVSKIWSQETK